MVRFSAKIFQFSRKPGQSGWMYIIVNKRQAEMLNPGCRKSFRVKGYLDRHKIRQISLLPMGEGKFFMPMNAALRKGTGKTVGDKLDVQLEVDKNAPRLSKDFIQCLQDDARAYAFFNMLPKGHQHYFSQWIESAKTIGTKTKRITMAVVALGAGQGFSEMMQANKRMEPAPFRDLL